MEGHFCTTVKRKPWEPPKFISGAAYDIAIANIVSDKIKQAGGHRYKNARKPELYKDIIGQPNQSVQQVVWLKDSKWMLIPDIFFEEKALFRQR